ncbi:hypothetical protein GOODEAATRI_027191 [Goodea atripinnis]|uniref:Uncharacterized protein n=1 Tax=Goodea atripinnis TaxID=208336 RepID=A0ABV0MVJ1_9TELE
MSNASGNQLSRNTQKSGFSAPLGRFTRRTLFKRDLISILITLSSRIRFLFSNFSTVSFKMQQSSSSAERQISACPMLLVQSLSCFVISSDALSMPFSLPRKLRPEIAYCPQNLLLDEQGLAFPLSELIHMCPKISSPRSVDEWVSEDSFPSTVSPGSLLISLFLGTCAMLVKETGITVFAVCLLYDALVLCRDPLTK